MAGVRFDPGTAAGRVWLTLYVVLAILGGSLVYSGGIPEKATPPLIVDLRRSAEITSFPTRRSSLRSTAGQAGLSIRG